MIGTLQQQVADQISSQPFFAHIPVITELAGDIVNEMARALGPVSVEGGKVGGIVVVMSPDANASFKELSGPFFDQIDIHVQVTTHVEFAKDPDAGIGVTDLDICEAVCKALNQFYPTSANSPLAPKTPTIQLMEKEGGLTTRLCRFNAQSGLSADLTRVALPGISNNTGIYTLSCATPGAAIFYTLDGSNPMPRNGTFYTAPFTPTTGRTLKVRAFLAGYLNSDFAITTT